jgi:hypothetical protein
MTAVMREYLLVWRDTSIRLVGPFGKQSEAAAFGRKVYCEGEDDPRWHCIELGDTMGIPVIAPAGEKKSEKAVA